MSLPTQVVPTTDKRRVDVRGWDNHHAWERKAFLSSELRFVLMIFTRRGAVMLSEQLRQAIIDFGTSQVGVAHDCGLSPSTVSRFLAGKGGLSLDAADRLAGCLRLVLVPEREWQRRDIIW